jgi:hypothetical protein
MATNIDGWLNIRGKRCACYFGDQDDMVLRLTPNVPLRRGDHRSPHDREVDYFLHGNAGLRSPQPMPHPFDGFVAAAKVFADANDEAIRDDVGRGQFMNLASHRNINE